jgi:hypothetical protein
MRAGVSPTHTSTLKIAARRYGRIAPPAMGRKSGAATGVAPVDCGGYIHRDCPHRNTSRFLVFHGWLIELILCAYQRTSTAPTERASVKAPK